MQYPSKLATKKTLLRKAKTKKQKTVSTLNYLNKKLLNLATLTLKNLKTLLRLKSRMSDQI
jgi:hypothetical protein